MLHPHMQLPQYAKKHDPTTLDTHHASNRRTSTPRISKPAHGRPTQHRQCKTRTCDQEFRRTVNLPSTDVITTKRAHSTVRLTACMIVLDSKRSEQSAECRVDGTAEWWLEMWKNPRHNQRHAACPVRNHVTGRFCYVSAQMIIHCSSAATTELFGG